MLIDLETKEHEYKGKSDDLSLLMKNSRVKDEDSDIEMLKYYLKES